MRLIVPFSQGGPTDFVARLVAERLTRGLGVQVVIENRGGAGTNIGAELVARANPDGYTVLVGTGALAINRNLYRTLAYDAATDLAPVTLMVILPFFMFVPNSSPARSVAEFVALAKANRGKIKFGSPGTGTPPHLAGELLKQLAGIEMTHVPYRGASTRSTTSSPAASICSLPAVRRRAVLAGQIRALAGVVRAGTTRTGIASHRRDDPGFDVTSWYALFVPAKTPPQIIEKLSDATVTALADPAVKDRLEQLVIRSASTPDELVQLSGKSANGSRSSRRLALASPNELQVQSMALVATRAGTSKQEYDMRWSMIRALAVVLLAALSLPARAQAPDKVLVNGKIITVDGTFTIAQALAIRGARIVAVGTTADIEKLKGPTTQTIDLRGRTVIPGLIDNHAHWIRAAEHWHQEVRLDGVTSRAGDQDAHRAGRRRASGEWIVALGGWSEEQFTDEPARLPTRRARPYRAQ